VIHCSSVSKVLSPGLRVGWIAAGRFQREVNRIKLLTNLASSSLPQHVVAEFLASGGYDRHLARLRIRLADQMERVRQAVARYFPDGTRVSRPAGGHMLWVELPGRTDAVRVFHEALAQRISVLPGPIFSPGRRYRNYLRLNCGHVWSEKHERALVTLGRICLGRG
ncbi:MAG: aminotransferase class I/II-fold pyridoxal phosphate-dependent enzyme, partial [Candidatus Eiseniibacteriota bacterium]